MKNILRHFLSLIKKIGDSKSIQTKLILAFLVPILLIVLQGIISYQNISKTTVRLSSQSSVTAMGTGGKYLEVVFRSIDTLAGQLFTDQDILDYLSGKYQKSDSGRHSELGRAIYNGLIPIKTFNKDISQITILAAKDNINSITTYRSTETRVRDLEKAAFYEKVAGNNNGIWVGFHEEYDKLNSANVSAGSYGLSYIRRIRNIISNETIGLLIIDIRPAVVTELMEDIKLAEKGQQLHLVSPDGRVITNGKDMGTGSNLTKQNFFQEIVKSKNSEGSSNINYENNKYLMTYNKIGQSGYILLGFIPESELESSSRMSVATTFVLILLAGFIALGTGYLIASSMSRTINRIIGASEQAASGDLSVTFDSRRKDELGTLTRSIDAMIGSMRRLIEQTTGVMGKVTASVETVSATSRHVSSVSTEISKAIEEISQGASAQAADAEKGAERISDLAERIGTVTSNAGSIDTLTKKMTAMTQRGLDTVNDLDAKAGRTTVISREIMKEIQELELQSKSIGKIIKVIGSIADQTNLLSLNAAIEAARAGAMGKGFAVVADEVRKLAEQSMNAAREISGIVRSTQDKTALAVSKAVETETMIHSQNEAVLGTVEIFKEILSSTLSLSAQVDQIMEMIVSMEENKELAIASMQNISAVSQETAASSEEVAASAQEQMASIEDLAGKAEELKHAADELKRNIMRFKLG